MAKRFYDTNLINQEWYMELSPKHKALYLHLLCSCDVAGVFEVNYRMMSLFVNDTITEEDVFSAFGNRVVPLFDRGTKGIIVDFVSFQCGGELNARVKAHISIIRRLKELDLTPEALNDMCNHKFIITGFDVQSSQKPTVQRVKKDTTEDAVIELMFVRLWNAYPRHDSKKVALAKFTTIMKGTKKEERESIIQNMIASIEASSKTDQWNKDDGKYIPMLPTWLNQRRWEDEGVIQKDHASSSAQKTLASVIASGLKI